MYTTASNVVSAWQYIVCDRGVVTLFGDLVTHVPKLCTFILPPRDQTIRLFARNFPPQRRMIFWYAFQSSAARRQQQLHSAVACLKLLIKEKTTNQLTNPWTGHVLRSTQNTQTHCDGRTLNCWLINLAVHIVTTGL